MYPKLGFYPPVLAPFFLNPHPFKLNPFELHAPVVPCFLAMEGCHANPDSDMERSFHVAP